jgi:hypothetical protein
MVLPVIDAPKQQMIGSSWHVAARRSLAHASARSPILAFQQPFPKPPRASVNRFRSCYLRWSALQWDGQPDVDSGGTSTVDIGHQILSLVSVSGTFGSVLAAFAKFDADQSDKNRKFVREWLLGIKVDDRHWAEFFKDLFTRAFGDRHLSAKCIRRSALFTMSLCLAILAFGYFRYYRSEIGLAIYLFGSVLWTMLAIVADYLSLWKTRILLTRSNLLTGGFTAAAVVVGDAIATLLVGAVALEVFPLLGYLFVTETADNSETPLQLAKEIITFAFSSPRIEDSKEGVTRLLFLAPLFTSAWLWAYLVVAYAMRAANYLPSWLRPLSKVMDFESHPVRTIGYVAATVSALIVGIITLV